MHRHPAKHELMAYAESLADRGAPVCAKTGAHVAACPACQEEVAAMHTTLAAVAEAPALEPSPALTAQLLMNAQAVRRKRAESPVRGRRAAWQLGKGLAYAAGLIVIGATCFGMALRDGGAVSPRRRPSMQQMALAGPSAESLRKMVTEIRTLAAAIDRPEDEALSVQERQYRRELLVLDESLSEARAALERNPGCVRASVLVNENLQRQAQALRTLYAERDF